ncbi:MAG: class I SAM-dependent methyltransferase [Verrucomicrobia bacterium]|nr:MAG: class I SAM-dependent methyltransferase [Verrucomicrobiota bacterium]
MKGKFLIFVILAPIICFGKEQKKNSPVFTTDWFSNNIEVWDTYKTEFDRKPNIRCLEIGSWEGRSSLYIARNYCNGPDSRLYCIDTWEGSKEHSDELRIGLYERFLGNTKDLRKKKRIVAHRGYSKEVLLELSAKINKGKGRKFNFIYIDGSHEAKDVLMDAVLAWELLEEGGILIFDDYGWCGDSHHCPKPAIDGFLACYKTMYEILLNGYQIHVRKVRSTPL